MSAKYDPAEFFSAERRGKVGGENAMKQLQTAQTEHNLNDVFAIDRPGKGGACHAYQVYRHGEVFYDAVEKCLSTEPHCEKEPVTLADIRFQNGTRNEPDSVPGVTEEDLLEIVRDRLEDFQNGPFPCQQNADALNHVTEALICLAARTQNRAERGVLGANTL